MKLIECLLTANDCYNTNQTIKPKGVMVHSTGANNKNIKRYVNPLKTAPDYNRLIALIGKNLYGNHWNKRGTGKCVHAFIGTLADGSIGTVQTLPWDHRGWHAGSGKNGSANNTHISFEICEDNLKDKTYFDKVYKEAVELTAMLCKKYGLDPLADGVVICHNEGYKRGVASGHADVTHWFPKHLKDMDDFRMDVKKAMGGTVVDPVLNKSVRVDSAKSYNKEYSKTYTVNAMGGLNMRSGASTKKAILTVLNHGSKFRCYGYYTKQSDGTVWLYGIADGKTGYCSKTYLK